MWCDVCVCVCPTSAQNTQNSLNSTLTEYLQVLWLQVNFLPLKKVFKQITALKEQSLTEPLHSMQGTFKRKGKGTDKKKKAFPGNCGWFEYSTNVTSIFKPFAVQLAQKSKSELAQ